jgi:hypothetical protein
MNPKKMKFGTSLRMTTSPDAAGSLPIPPGTVEAAAAPARAVILCRRCLPMEQCADGRVVRRGMVACIAGRRATRRCHQRMDAAGQHLRTPVGSPTGSLHPAAYRADGGGMDAHKDEQWTRALAVVPAVAIVGSWPLALPRGFPPRAPHGKRRRQPCSMEERAGLGPTHAPPVSTATAPAWSKGRRAPPPASALSLCHRKIGGGG